MQSTDMGNRLILAADVEQRKAQSVRAIGLPEFSNFHEFHAERLRLAAQEEPEEPVRRAAPLEAGIATDLQVRIRPAMLLILLVLGGASIGGLVALWQILAPFFAGGLR